MKTKIVNIIKAYISDFFTKLKDIRFAGQVVFVIIVLLISWSGIKAIRLNYNLQKQITTAKQENEIESLQNKNISLENEYYNSKQFLEIQARENFGLADPGEQEVLVPTSVALAAAPNVNINDTEPVKITVPSYEVNIKSWVDYLLHRQ